MSAYRPDVYDEARRALSLGQNIEVMMDRRVGERRRPTRVDSGPERRMRAIAEELRTEGYVIAEVQ